MKLAGMLLALVLALAPAASLAQEAVPQEVSEQEHHGHLSLRRMLLGDAGEGASEQEASAARHEMMEFWGAVVNFTLLVLLIRHMSKKPLSSFLEGRRRAVEQGMAEASVLKEKAEAVFNEYSERMKTLDQELAKMRTDMAAAAQADRARILAEAEESAKHLQAETQAFIVRQTELLEAQIRREVVDAAVAAAENAVKQAATQDDQQRLADAFARELARAGMEKRA